MTATFGVTVSHAALTGAVSGFPVYVDLADMPVAFWVAVSSGGGNIRCHSGGVELAREVVSCDTTAKTGELHVKVDLSATADTVITVTVDGTSADYAASDPYGRDAVWAGFMSVRHGAGSAGQVGVGDSFDGTGSIELGASIPTGNDVRTTSVWVKPTDSSSRCMWGSGIAGVGQLWEMARYGGSLIWHGYGDGYDTISVSAPVAQDVWSHCALSYDGTDVRVYVNGVLMGSRTPVAPLDTTYDHNLLGSGGFFSPWLGDLDEARLSSVARSAAWIAAEYANQSSPGTFYTVTEITTAPGVATFAEPFTGTDHDDFAAWARELREYRIERAYDRPVAKLYDGDWNYRGTVSGENAGSVNIEVNETGNIQLRLPIDLDEPRRTWAAFWALDEEARGTSNIHIIVETMGARIGGRMRPKNGVTIIRGEKGDEVVIDFLDDIEELKNVYTAGNPFLPISLIQQPKAWMLYLQADHAILLTLACNLLRLQLTNIDIGSILQLLDPANWTLEGLVDALRGFWQQSQIVVVPRTFGDSVAPLSLVVGSIKTSIFDVAAPIMEDAELQWELTRWLTGDPEPWPGAGTGWRNGTLFVRIVDKSNFRAGTSIGGNLITGLSRTLADLLSNHVEDSYDLITGETIDETGYRLPGILGTLPAHPYVTYRDGDITGIQTSEFSRSPGGAGRITVGGRSMPGVNELISAAIQYGGDVLGDNISAAISAGIGYTVSVGSLGGALDSFLNPIYRDSILAHMSVPLLLRVSKQGWGHYLETTSTNVTQAFTAASIMDLRRRRRETDPDTAFTLQIANASPWLIGDNGFGHWWLGDRVGGTSKYLMPRVFVRRNRKLGIDWDNQGLAIGAQFGDTRNEKDAIERMAELTARAMSGLQEIGLW